MDESKKKEIIDKLDDKKYWRRYYSVANRQWFTRTIIDHLLSQGRPDDVIEAETTDIIEQAGVIVSEKVKSRAPTELDLKLYWNAKTDGTSLRQIIYNMIALHPEFLQPGNEDYMNFIIDRRYRMVKRMQFFVNDNLFRGFFFYPGIPFGAPEGVSRLNSHARSFWQGLKLLNGENTKPFILSATGKADPVAAVTKIFEKGILFDRNYCYCDDLLGILLADSLITAFNADKLIKTLDAESNEHFKIDHPFHHYGTWDECATLLATVTKPISSGSNVEVQLGNSSSIMDDAPDARNENVGEDIPYKIGEDVRYLLALGDAHEVISPLKINFQTKKLLVKQIVNNYPGGAKIYISKLYEQPPNNPYPTYHFMNDSRPDKTLFEQPNINMTQLQVADTVKVKNHILYTRYFRGAAGEENAIAMEIAIHSTKNAAFDTGLKLAGHGMSEKDGSGYSVKQMTTQLLNIVNILMGIFSIILKEHRTNFQANGNADSAQVHVVPKTIDGKVFDFFEYDLNRKFILFGNTSSSNEGEFKGFVIRQRRDNEKEFTIININTKDSNLPINQEFTLPTATPYVVVKLDDIYYLGNDAEFEAKKTKLSLWGLRYLDTTAMKAKSFFLYEKDDKTPKRFSFGDLKKERTFFLRFDNDRDLIVTRPKVDFSAAYQTFLKTSGAIP